MVGEKGGRRGAGKKKKGTMYFTISEEAGGQRC